jgi:hypothetical protein
MKLSTASNLPWISGMKWRGGSLNGLDGWFGDMEKG